MPEHHVVSAIQAALGCKATGEEAVLLHEPWLPVSAWEKAKECLDTGWISSAGASVNAFEEQISALVGGGYAVATVNGTAALQVALGLADVRAEDEVICPALSFVATANAIVHAGGTPHFADVDRERLGLCPTRLEDRLAKIATSKGGECWNRETGKRIAAVCPVHCLGMPCDMDGLLEVCNKYELPIVEDAAESLGSTYKGRSAGTFGRLGVVSFNGNKIVSTGGGGAILTQEPALAAKARHLTSTAKTPHRWEFHHDNVAWNFRMPNINAAIGCAQLDEFDSILAAKRRLHQRYITAFSDVQDVHVFEAPQDSECNHWLNCLLLNDSQAKEDALTALNEAGLQSRPLWQPLHTLPMFADCPRGSLENTEWCYSVAVTVPSSPKWGIE